MDWKLFEPNKIRVKSQIRWAYVQWIDSTVLRKCASLQKHLALVFCIESIMENNSSTEGVEWFRFRRTITPLHLSKAKTGAGTKANLLLDENEMNLIFFLLICFITNLLLYLKEMTSKIGFPIHLSKIAIVIVASTAVPFFVAKK